LECRDKTVLPTDARRYTGPPLSAENREKAPMENTPAAQSNQKTILVVDDEPSVLKSVSAVLLDGNYKVLTAPSGSLGLQQSREYKGDIDLLLADFSMAAMSGVDLATQMTIDRPQLKVLLMSGFPNGMLVLDEGWHFLAKPFIRFRWLCTFEPEAGRRVQIGCRSDSDDNRSLTRCTVMFESPALNAASISRIPAAAESRKLRSWASWGTGAGNVPALYVGTEGLTALARQTISLRNSDAAD